MKYVANAGSDLKPLSIDGREDVEGPIRNALVARQLHATVTLPVAAKKPSLTLALDYCAHGDGTPVWDVPLDSISSSVRATRADGEFMVFEACNTSWDDLVTALMGFMEGWDDQVVDALEVAQTAARSVDRLKSSLVRARDEQERAAVAAVDAGASMYRVAKTMDRAEVTVKSWVQKKQSAVTAGGSENNDKGEVN